MKHGGYIAALNLALLLGSVILLSNSYSQSTAFYFLPVIALTVINLLIGSIYHYKGLKSQANHFILSGLMVLIIGGSSCVTIKFRSKPKEPKKPKPTEQVKPVKKVQA